MIETSARMIRQRPLWPLLGLTAVLLGGTGCPGHLDQIGWDDTDGGTPAYSNTTPEPMNNTPGADAAPPVQNPPVQNPPVQNPPVQNPPVQSADGGAAPDAKAPPVVVPTPDAAPPAPDMVVAAPVTPVCATPEEIATKILVPKCGTCHGKNAPAAQLDLVTAGSKARMLNVAAKGCSGKVLITAGAQVGGYFFDKLVGAVPNCGGQMPFGAPPLSDVEIKCLKDWIKPTP